MTSPRQWWRRAAAAVKDKRSILLAMLPLPPRKELRNPDMMAAVIRATSHDERSIDYKNAGRIFAWARTSPSLKGPLMWAVGRRAERTRSWPVALKSLLLAHGLLLTTSSGTPQPPLLDGRLPFDLSDFRDRYSGNSWGFSAFVRAYFHFLDNRAVLLSATGGGGGDDDCGVGQVEKLQKLLGLLMQIRPYADGMGVGLILEAMDCAVIEIFNVYSGICSGIASFLVGILGSNPNPNPRWKAKGMRAIRVLRRAGEQSLQLRSYFAVCRSLGVLNATEFPPVERIPDEDIMDLEKLLVGEIPRVGEQHGEEEERMDEDSPSKTVVTRDWVVFEDELRSQDAYLNNPFACSASDRQWASMVHCKENAPWNGNLIELV